MYSIRKKFPANTNTIRFEKITRIRIRIIFGLKKLPNTNTNNIRFEKITRIRMRIIFGLQKSPEYKYEQDKVNYAVSERENRVTDLTTLTMMTGCTGMFWAATGLSRAVMHCNGV